MEKRITSFFTERRYLKNAILKRELRKEAFAPWTELFRLREEEEEDEGKEEGESHR